MAMNKDKIMQLLGSEDISNQKLGYNLAKYTLEMDDEEIMMMILNNWNQWKKKYYHHTSITYIFNLLKYEIILGFHVDYDVFYIQVYDNDLHKILSLDKNITSSTVDYDYSYKDRIKTIFKELDSNQ